MPDEGLDYNFRGRRQNEAVILVVKFHKWLLMPIAYWWLATGLVIGLAVYYLGATSLVSVIVSLLVLVAIFYSLYQWFLWNGGNYIITNQRVIRTEQISLFRRQIAEAEISRIQEISTEIRGPIHTMLGFGTVKIRTATGGNSVDIEDIANPYDIQQEIARVQQQLAETGHTGPTINRPKGLS
ncbi:MAG TPA: PH domain-containing protein [Candidatus Saccharimonadales bacterium]|nr:PH domain-containing protein [Candidatus Saccharimonadales bacterium]